MVPLPENLNSFSKEYIRKFLYSFDTVLTDCDGVLWLGPKVIESTQHVMNRFYELNKSVFYVTNNNSKTREEFAEKCQLLGHKYARKENILCTSYLAAEYLQNLGFNQKVYVLGNEGIIEELDKVGIKHTGIGPDILESNLDSYINGKLELDHEVRAVLVGFDQHFSYPKLIKAATYLKDPDVYFLATCPDESLPCLNSNIIVPGTGCFVKCLEAASGRKAFVLGKPNDYIKEAILKRHELTPSRTLMIGDRCNTDILFGKRCGFKTLLVMTGVTSARDLVKYATSSDPSDNELVPDYCINNLGDLLPHLTELT